MEEILRKNKDCKTKISERHLQDIAKSLCEDWRHLPVHLGMNAIVEKDIDRDLQKESEKRRTFFYQWEKEKGSEASYEKLIFALLLIKNKRDAESICEMVPRADHDSKPPSDPSSAATARTGQSKVNAHCIIR